MLRFELDGCSTRVLGFKDEGDFNWPRRAECAEFDSRRLLYEDLS